MRQWPALQQRFCEEQKTAPNYSDVNSRTSVSESGIFSGPAPNTVLKADIRVLVIVDISEETPRGRFASGHSDQLVPFAASTENIM